MASFTFEQKLECVRREAEMRRKVYKRRVEVGFMAQQFAEQQITLMESIVADYEEMAKRERLL